jgi:hypothetical protein
MISGVGEAKKCHIAQLPFRSVKFVKLRTSSGLQSSSIQVVMLRVPRILVTIIISTLVSLWLLITFVWVGDFKTNLVLSMSAFMASQSHNVTTDVKSTATVLSWDSPASIQFSAWLAAFNSHDRATLLAYHAAHFPYDVASRDISNIHREMLLSTGTGGFDIIEILNASEASHVSEALSTTDVILREKKDPIYARATMQVDLHKDDHPVAKFEINPTHANQARPRV